MNNKKFKGTFSHYDFVSYETAKNFGTNQQNRMIDHGHKKEIKNEMLESFPIMPPVVVNTLTNNIIDGQHRAKSFIELIDEGEFDKDMRLDVKYVTIPVEYEFGAIIRANTNTKNWTLENYINAYAKMGNEYYTKLIEWCKSHALSLDGKGKSKYRYGAAIITGKRCNKELTDGIFKFSDEELKVAETIHAELYDIIELFPELSTVGAWIESLAVEWKRVRHLHTFDVWYKAIKASKKEISNMPKHSGKDWNLIFSYVNTNLSLKAAA